MNETTNNAEALRAQLEAKHDALMRAYEERDGLADRVEAQDALIARQAAALASQPQAAGVTDADCEAIYDAVARSGLTRDVKTPERKREIVRAALHASQKEAPRG